MRDDLFMVQAGEGLGPTPILDARGSPRPPGSPLPTRGGGSVETGAAGPVVVNPWAYLTSGQSRLKQCKSGIHRVDAVLYFQIIQGQVV
jgi:hypothetical protein